MKRIRQTVIRTERNRAGRSKVKHAVRAFRTAVEEKAEGLNENLSQTIAIISKAASKGIIPAKRASRKISRLSLLLNASKA
jgi:small subunit ribosomal protein S20